jgi:hypothetical protein
VAVCEATHRKGNAVAAQTVLAQTILLAFRIAFVWAGGILIAVAVSAVLPSESGIPFPAGKTDLLIPYSRLGFWTCIWAAVTVTVLVVVRSMLADFGLSTTR